jgi:hypothetical protein
LPFGKGRWKEVAVAAAFVEFPIIPSKCQDIFESKPRPLNSACIYTATQVPRQNHALSGYNSEDFSLGCVV